MRLVLTEDIQYGVEIELVDIESRIDNPLTQGEVTGVGLAQHVDGHSGRFLLNQIGLIAHKQTLPQHNITRGAVRNQRRLHSHTTTTTTTTDTTTGRDRDRGRGRRSGRGAIGRVEELGLVGRTEEGPQRHRACRQLGFHTLTLILKQKRAKSA